MALYSRRPVARAAVLLIGIAAAVQPLGSPPAASAACTDTAASRADAAALARACDRTVEAVDARTGTDQVFALPDGTWRLERRARPVRVQRAGGGWVPVDTSLRFAPDGSVVPGATSVGLVFSGGGAAPLVQLTSGDRRLDVGSPFGALPRPVLDGNTATYPDVLPGVDLRLTADVEGYTEVLVVRSRAAAANPALRRISFPYSGPGLRTTVDAAGNVRVLDDTGAIVFGGEQPSMWDSRPAEAHAHADGQAHAHAPGRPGGRHGPRMPTEVTQAPGRPASVVSITPSQEYLQHPETVYPVLIDPPLTRYKLGWTYVSADCGTCTFWNSSSRAQTGPIEGHTHMSYFRMSLADLHYRTDIVSATFHIDLLWTASSFWKETELWETQGISSSTSWNNRPGKNAYLGQVVLNAPANGVAWGVTDRLKHAVHNYSDWTLGLFSLNDSDWAYGKEWSNNPALVVIYNSPPDVPSVQPFTECRTQCVSPASVRTRTPTFRAAVSDPNGGQVRADFEVRMAPGDSGALLASTTTGPVSSGQTATWTIGSGVLADSTVYWRVRARDEMDWVSGWTGWQTVTIDTVPPGTPSVSSVEYPAGQWGAVVGTTGTFTFRRTPADGIVAFLWSVGASSTTEVPATTSCISGVCTASATIQFTPTTDMGKTLWVDAIDRAGNIGYTYHEFKVRPLPNRCWRWLLDETAGSTAADTGNSDANDQLCGPIGPSVSPRPGNLLGGVSWVNEPTAGPRAKFARFDGVSGEIYTSDPVLDTTKSFTVMAWVRLGALPFGTGYQTILSQPGAAVDRFALRYSKDANGGAGGWCFDMHASDAAGTRTSACATGTVGDSVPPAVGRWVHLAAVYHEVQNGTDWIEIHVMGNQESCNGERVQADVTGSWSGTQYFEIGLSYAGWENHDVFRGDIDQVYAFQRPLFTSEICQQAREG